MTIQTIMEIFSMNNMILIGGVYALTLIVIFYPRKTAFDSATTALYRSRLGSPSRVGRITSPNKHTAIKKLKAMMEEAMDGGFYSIEMSLEPFSRLERSWNFSAPQFCSSDDFMAKIYRPLKYQGYYVDIRQEKGNEILIVSWENPEAKNDYYKGPYKKKAFQPTYEVAEPKAYDFSPGYSFSSDLPENVVLFKQKRSKGMVSIKGMFSFGASSDSLTEARNKEYRNNVIQVDFAQKRRVS